MVHAYQERNGYPWMMAPFSRETILAYDVKVQSTKFAVDVDGIITYQKGYGIGSARRLAPGSGGPSAWRRVSPTATLPFTPRHLGVNVHVSARGPRRLTRGLFLAQTMR